MSSVDPGQENPNVRIEYVDKQYRVWVDDVEISSIVKRVSFYAYARTPPTITVEISGGELKMEGLAVNVGLGLNHVLNQDFKPEVAGTIGPLRG